MKIEKSYKYDKTAEVIAWLLSAPVRLVIDGNSEEQKDFGEAKWTLQAVQDAVASK